MTKHNIFNIALACAFISALLISMVGFSNSCEEMYTNIIRIRIIPNSDSAEDQSLKLQIRDAVLSGSEDLFSETQTYKDALTTAENNIELFEHIANEEIKKAGFDYSVSVQIRNEYFETREYDDFTLPAGVYKTAVFTVGEGKGQNWWCVVFPQVCVGSCSGKLTDTVSESTAELAYNSDRYVIRFKTVEIFEKIKNYLDF